MEGIPQPGEADSDTQARADQNGHSWHCQNTSKCFCSALAALNIQFRLTYAAYVLTGKVFLEFLQMQELGILRTSNQAELRHNPLLPTPGAGFVVVKRNHRKVPSPISPDYEMGSSKEL